MLLYVSDDSYNKHGVYDCTILTDRYFLGKKRSEAWTEFVCTMCIHISIQRLKIILREGRAGSVWKISDQW